MGLEPLGARDLVGLHGLCRLRQRLERGAQGGERLLATLAQALLARRGAQRLRLGLGLGEGGHHRVVGRAGGGRLGAA